MEPGSHEKRSTHAVEHNGHGNGALRNFIVIGGSAGGMQSLCALLKSLPPDFSVPICAVLHMAEGQRFLAQCLQRCTALKVVVPSVPQPIQPGHLYLPHPNRHLMLRSGCVSTAMGPRESRHRPSVDTLFRTAARAYRDKVIAIVLSGALDDGSAGAFAIKARGGLVIIEDPATAQVDSMPASVLAHVKTDYSLPAAQIGPLLAQLARTNPGQEPNPLPDPSAATNPCGPFFDPIEQDVEPQGYTCPECGGVLAAVKQGNSTNFRCHVGHTFSLQSLSEGHVDSLERALWLALRKLNEQYAIQSALASSNSSPMKQRSQENAAQAKADMDKLHEILAHH
ncbi:MAG: chemotaxis protein CheB [Verrucomicrobiia bacterium]